MVVGVQRPAWTAVRGRPSRQVVERGDVSSYKTIWVAQNCVLMLCLVVCFAYSFNLNTFDSNQVTLVDQFIYLASKFVVYKIH